MATIIDLTRMLAGPFATQALGDLGHRIIKVEEARVGDATRRHPPFHKNISAYFFSANRNKESVILDLKHPDGRKVFLDLVRKADAVIENFRPGVMDSIGLSFADLQAVNPAIILVSISGFGSYGPLRDNVSFDVVAQAMSGSMAVTTPDPGEPIKPAIPLGDLSGGLYGAQALLQALLERKVTGQGCHKEVSLFDGLVAMSGRLGEQYLLAERTDERPALLFPNGVFGTADGHIALAAYTDQAFAALAGVLRRPSWAADPRFATIEGRSKNRVAIEADLRAALAARPSSEWLAAFAAASVPATRLRTIDQLMQCDDLAQNGMILTMDHPVAGPLPAFGNPIKRKPAYRPGNDPAPRHGQHTRSVLAGLLGYPPAEIERLIAAKAISDLVPEAQM
ncbi:MAG: CoA transferase [Alphaproteobacteria bacterium]